MRTIIELLLKELESEVALAKKMISVIPEDKFSWQPHPKSMSVKQLATHIGELPGWIGMVLTTKELDFENNPYKPRDINTLQGLLDYLEESYQYGKRELEKSTDRGILEENWILRSGKMIFSDTSKYEFLRITLGQIIHHRAQLGVFMRLLDVKIPGTYGPSADE